jgi:hypothetical protein
MHCFRLFVNLASYRTGSAFFRTRGNAPNRGNASNARVSLQGVSEVPVAAALIPHYSMLMAGSSSNAAAEKKKVKKAANRRPAGGRAEAEVSPCQAQRSRQILDLR